MAFRQDSLTAQNTFTEPELPVNEGARILISISGVSDSTVTLQRRMDGTNWRDVTDGSFTADAEKTYVADSDCDLRLGIKTGDYGTDTVVCRLGGKE